MKFPHASLVGLVAWQRVDRLQRAMGRSWRGLAFERAAKRGATCRSAASSTRAFTLIETMIVIAIMGIVISAGIPMVWKAMAKDQLAKAVNDVIEGCKTARDRAILRNRPYDFVIRNKSELVAEVTVEEAKIKDPSGLAYPGSASTAREPGSLMGDFPRVLGDDVKIQLIDVNFIDHMGAGEARVRFYQNGTSDEFTVVMQKDAVQRQVRVDIITGTAYEVVK